MIDKELLLEWRSATEAAPAGPWKRYAHDGHCVAVRKAEHIRTRDRGLADFIATARTAMPELLAEVERLRGVIAAASDDIGAVADRDCMTYNGCNLGWHNGKDTGDQCEHCDAGEIQERLDIAIGAKP